MGQQNNLLQKIKSLKSPARRLSKRDTRLAESDMLTVNTASIIFSKTPATIYHWLDMGMPCILLSRNDVRINYDDCINWHKHLGTTRESKLDALGKLQRNVAGAANA